MPNVKYLNENFPDMYCYVKLLHRHFKKKILVTANLATVFPHWLFSQSFWSLCDWLLEFSRVVWEVISLPSHILSCLVQSCTAEVPRTLIVRNNNQNMIWKKFVHALHWLCCWIVSMLRKACEVLREDLSVLSGFVFFLLKQAEKIFDLS